MAGVGPATGAAGWDSAQSVQQSQQQHSHKPVTLKKKKGPIGLWGFTPEPFVSPEEGWS